MLMEEYYLTQEMLQFPDVLFLLQIAMVWWEHQHSKLFSKIMQYCKKLDVYLNLTLICVKSIDFQYAP